MVRVYWLCSVVVVAVAVVAVNALQWPCKVHARGLQAHQKLYALRLTLAKRAGL